jgi:RNA polymerase sigma factor (sigma-70 family)
MPRMWCRDAYLRAYRYFDTFQGAKFRPWLLAIVRNVFFTWAKENRSSRMVFVADMPAGETAEIEETMWCSPTPDPECQLLESIESDALARLMEDLPAEYRDVLLLREVEELSYEEIASVSGAPIGTVMSRLSRARLALRTLWKQHAETESTHAAPAQVSGAPAVKPALVPLHPIK